MIESFSSQSSITSRAITTQSDDSIRSFSGEERISARLDVCQNFARRREFHIRLICCGAGALIWACGAPGGFLCFFQFLPGRAGSLGAGAYWSYSILGAQMCAVAFKPTDRKWMPRAIIFICVWMVVVGIMLIAACVGFKVSDCAMHGFDGYACDVWASCFGICAVPNFAVVAVCVRAVRWNSRGYILDARQMLEMFWLGCRLFGAGIGSVILTHTIVLAGLDVDFAQSLRFRGYVAMGVIWILQGILSTSSNRRRLVAVIGRIGRDGEVQEAAVIASVVGLVGTTQTIQLSKKIFRGIKVGKLTAHDFASREDTGLFEKTRPKQLGHVDAFISHSWSDRGDLKFEALQRWQRSFQRLEGREPTIWLDKACINQQDIATSLACLPVFIAGCDYLVVLYGPTYAERLWCVLEIFTFLKMGGDFDRMFVIPINDDTLGMSAPAIDQLAVDFENFDAQEAKCFDESDRQHLLSVIEEGFGDFDGFNSIIRHALSTRLISFSRTGTSKMLPSPIKPKGSCTAEAEFASEEEVGDAEHVIEQFSPTGAAPLEFAIGEEVEDAEHDVEQPPPAETCL